MKAASRSSRRRRRAAVIDVRSPGTLTTVQDLGRTGLGALGVPPAGAMDPWALRAGNILVGNDEGAAGLEMTLTGPTLSFDKDTVLALTGSEFEATLDAKPVRHETAFRVGAGQTLRIGRTREGARAYLAVRGGVAVAPVLGSRSTHLSAGFGGLDGRALRAGDTLPVGEPSGDPPLRRIAFDAFPPYRSTCALRALDGPQMDRFDPDAFYETCFNVTPHSDRTGIRLEAPPLEHAGATEVLPQGVPAGAVQVTGDGRLILLCAERPATGGYPVVASVIAADLALAAYAKPGDTFRFVRTGIDQARAALRAREWSLRLEIREL